MTVKCLRKPTVAKWRVYEHKTENVLEVFGPDVAGCCCILQGLRAVCDVSRQDGQSAGRLSNWLNWDTLKSEFLKLHFLIFKLSPCSVCLYVFFWVIPRRLNFICRRFGTHCLFHLHRRIDVECRNIKFRCRGITQKKTYNITFVTILLIFWAFVFLPPHPLFVFEICDST